VTDEELTVIDKHRTGLLARPWMVDESMAAHLSLICIDVQLLIREVRRLADTGISLGEQAVRATAQAEETFKVVLRVRQQRDALRWPHDFGNNSSRTERTKCVYCGAPYSAGVGRPCPDQEDMYRGMVVAGDLDPVESPYSDEWLRSHP